MSNLITLTQDQSTFAYRAVSNVIDILEESISKSNNHSTLEMILTEMESLLDALEISLTLDVDSHPYAQCVAEIKFCIDQK